jgi:hypothetical protein
MSVVYITGCLLPVDVKCFESLDPYALVVSCMVCIACVVFLWIVYSMGRLHSRSSVCAYHWQPLHFYMTAVYANLHVVQLGAQTKWLADWHRQAPLQNMCYHGKGATALFVCSRITEGCERGVD